MEILEIVIFLREAMDIQEPDDDQPLNFSHDRLGLCFNT
jgi:hypothetical protein